MTRVIINGSKGRMGQALLSCGEANPDIEIAAGIDVGDSLADVIAASTAKRYSWLTKCVVVLATYPMCNAS